MDKAKHKWAIAEVNTHYPDPEDPVRQCLYALLHVWERLDVYAGQTGKKVDSGEVLDAFTYLVEGKSLAVEEEPEERIWGPAGKFLETGSTARVRRDFDKSPDGWRTNGRVGKIVAVRRGDVILQFSDELEGAPTMLRGDYRNFEADITARMAPQ